MGKLKGKEILDLGCGDGWVSIMCAKRGAKVTAFDISEESLKKARESARAENLNELITFEKAAAEYLKYTNKFDYIIGKAILHHTDLNRVRISIWNALKPGGKAFFLEPLDHNPLFKLYRLVTPWRRTPTEKPLCVDDIEKFKEIFSEVYYTGFVLVSCLAYIFIPFRNIDFISKTYGMLSQVDDSILRKIPFLHRHCWGAVITLRK